MNAVATLWVLAAAGAAVTVVVAGLAGVAVFAGVPLLPGLVDLGGAAHVLVGERDPRVVAARRG